MNVLIDECLPRRLTRELPDHEAKTVQQMGWSSRTNGELLALMARSFDVFITIDSNLIHQQNLPNLTVGLIVLRAKSNQIEDIRPLIPDMLAALNTISPGMVVRIGT